MPIISTETNSFDGREYKKQVRCNGSGEFFIKLPPTVVEKLGVEKVASDTLRGVLDAWEASIVGYKESQTKSRKIIAYSIEINKDISFAHGMALSIWAHVYIEHKTDIPGMQPVFDYDDVDFGEMLPKELQSGGDFAIDKRYLKEKNIIDWTSERHQFFVSIYKAMTNLIEKVQKMHNKEKLLEIVDSGIKLLEDT